MFTFLHAADLHLDSPLLGLAKHDHAPYDVVQKATRQALSNLVDLAIDEQVGFVVIAGDLYDGDWNDYNTGLFFVHEMRRLNEQNIPVYLISGNHDAQSKITKQLTLPENVHNFPTRKPGAVDHPNLPVTIHGQSFANQAVTENLAANYPQPSENHFNIGVLHTNLGDKEGHGNYAPSTLPQLRDHGYDYWALGHIHLREIHHESPHIVYPGNTQGRHIKETGAKGCYLVTVNDDLEVTDCDFRELDGVRWEVATVDCSEITDDTTLLAAIRDQLDTLIKNADSRLLAVRVVLEGHTTIHETLHADHSRYYAECLSLADTIGNDVLWIEKLKVHTRTLIDPQQLAQQDDLTAQVLDALDSFDPKTLPKEVQTLSSKLPTNAQQELKSSFAPDSDDDLEALRQDVAAIVLQAIATAD